MVNMLAHMHHRGPDEGGICDGMRFWAMDAFEPSTLSRIWLGNRRLRILDLSPAGRQPMPNEDNTIWVVLNGEIVNFQDLRDELAAKGHRFRSRTDTEVIVHAYEEWGDGFVNKLKGMFAIALWDGRRKAKDEGKLMLVRDPLGIKPLYVWDEGLRAREGKRKCLAFASEVRALLASGLVVPQLSLEGIWTYLAFGSVQEPFTIVDGIRPLPPGTLLIATLHPDGVQIFERSYFTLASFEEATTSIDSLRELLVNTMRQWLISDVPLGIFLSGGIDSAAVLSLARKALGKDSLGKHKDLPLWTFTIAFREESFNEAPLARRTAERFGAKHMEVLVTPEEVLSRLPEAIAAMDQPTMDGINTYFVSDAAKRSGLTVALSGLGGDEVFAGYSTFQTVPRLWRWQGWLFTKGVRKGAAWLISLLPIAPDAKTKLSSWLVGKDFLPDGMPMDSSPYLFARALFVPEMVDRLLATAEGQRDLGVWHERVSAVWQEAEKFEPMGKVSVLEMRHYLLNTLLRDTDFMSMAHSLEVRPPLLDTSIIANVLPLPDKMKRDGKTPKTLLVNAVGDLPNEVVYRRKTTFTFPWAEWLRGTLRSEGESTLKHLPERLLPVLNAEAVAKVWDAFEAGRTSWSRVWALFVLAKWVESVMQRW